MEERTIKLSLEKAKEYYEAGGELRQVALSAYREDELSPRKLPQTYAEFLTYIHRDNFRQYKKIVCEEIDEADRAFIALRSLRNYYRQGWKPNWADDSTKYCIINCNGCVKVIECYHHRQFLSFQTQELAEQFLSNFMGLIEIADIL